MANSAHSIRVSPTPADEQDAFTSYLAPTLIFGAFVALEGYVPREWYPFVYTVKIAAVIGAFFIWRACWRDVTVSWSAVPASVAIGLLVCVAWVGIDKLVPYPHIGSRIGFDPFTLTSPTGRAAFLGIRFLGLVMVVPVMEELFWRSFLVRVVTNGHFLSVPVGVFTPFAFVVMLAASAAAHNEWLVAIIASAAYGLWVKRTRSLFAAMVAHAVTNAALGVYILMTHDWQYW